MAAVLKIEHIGVEFDGFHALTDVSISVERNSIHCFIGPNGAGKTTLLDIICAKTKPTGGIVTFYPLGKEAITLTGMKEHRIVNAGVGRKFQVPSVFVNLSVYDNMVLSLKGHKGVLESIFYRSTSAERDAIDAALTRVGLETRKDDKAGTLAHGQKQWLEIAMQLLQGPELIMLDEPAAGMGEAETFKTGEILAEVKSACSVIVVEHDMAFVKQIADRATVLHEGKVLAEGSVDEVLSNETVQAVYLGRGGE
ncbi:MAG: urea ABC transporter ATP-binding protein UrtD [Oscillospiraceae bacterium]|jgi:urea transport system ATP-binding protein|nr:urea ABC transporter ATP-binding protein UrtD [Oscillospiraceae bacterium]